MKILLIGIVCLMVVSCGEKRETATPKESSITSSIYASGVVISNDQYNVYANAVGVVAKTYVEAGDTVSVGDSILLIDSKVQEINRQNAQLSTTFFSNESNRDAIENYKNSIQLARRKKEYDSVQFNRQRNLNNKGVGVGAQLETVQLNYENSIINLQKTINQYADFKRQLSYNASNAQNNYKIARLSAEDFLVTSDINGKVYQLNYNLGEVVNPQQPVAVIGSASDFTLEMLLDEKDILQVELGQQIKVTLESYGDRVFEAKLSKIYPMMDAQNRTFKLEAKFNEHPKVLYPNMNFEANIMLATKENALLIPREFLVNDQFVLFENGDTVAVETGLKDYRSVEILSGLSSSDLIVHPE